MCCEGQCHSSSPSPVLVHLSLVVPLAPPSLLLLWQQREQLAEQPFSEGQGKGEEGTKQHPAVGVCFSPHLRCGIIKSSEWLLRNHSAEFGASLYNKSLAIKTRGREHCQPVCPAHLVCCGGDTQHGQLYSLTGAWCHLLHNITLPLQL